MAKYLHLVIAASGPQQGTRDGDRSLLVVKFMAMMLVVMVLAHVMTMQSVDGNDVCHGGGDDAADDENDDDGDHDDEDDDDDVLMLMLPLLLPDAAFFRLVLDCCDHSGVVVIDVGCCSW